MLPSEKASPITDLVGAQTVFQNIANNIGRIIKDQSGAVRKLLAAFASGGHVLLEDYPGTGKTTLAKALARSINGDFQRIQCDVDGDELDEIVLIEHTGKRKRPVPTGDYMGHWDVANYIHVLKWSGEKYESIWTSPPFEDQTAKLWIGDLLGTGDKQIIVGTGKGTLQVWQKR